MNNFTMKELASVKELVASHQVLSSKLNNYASQTQDPEIKQFFKSAADDATKSSQSLIQMLD